MDLAFRPYRPDDGQALSALFFASVRQIGRRGYSQEQVEAWAPEPPAPANFDQRSGEGRLLLLACNGQGEPVAYAILEPDGHIDQLYARPDVVGQGVASALYDQLEQAARRQGMTRLYTEASEVARPLFAHKGFALIERRDFLRHGVPIHNYSMDKVLASPP